MLKWHLQESHASQPDFRARLGALAQLMSNPGFSRRKWCCPQSPRRVCYHVCRRTIGREPRPYGP